MKSEHFASHYKSPKTCKGSSERNFVSQSNNDCYNTMESKHNPKTIPTVRNVQLDPEIFSENVFLSSPNLRIHKSSPRFFISHQKSPEKNLSTTRISNDISTQKIAPLTTKHGSNTHLLLLESMSSFNDATPQKQNQGCIPAPRSNLSLSKKTSRPRPADGPREIVIQLTDENQPFPLGQSEQITPVKRSLESRKIQKPAIRVSTDILMKALSPRNLNEASCRNYTLPYESGSSCRNMTNHIHTMKEDRRYQIPVSRQSTEDLHARSEKSPLPRTSQVSANKESKSEVKSLQVLRTPESKKYTKRTDQVKRMKETRYPGEDNRRNMSQTRMKNKQEVSSKRNGPATMLSGSKKLDWNTIKKIEVTLDSRDSIRSFVGKNKYSRCSELLEDLVIFKQVLDFLPIASLCQFTRVSKKFRSAKHLSLLKKAQCRLIIKGLSYEEQYNFWDFQINFSFLQKAYPLQYTMNSMKPSNFEKDILNDIERTQHLPFSQQGSLLKILLSFSNTLPKIGYFQGLNSIAAVFLSQNLSEQEVYWMMKFIFQKKRFREVVADNFGKIHLLTYQLEIYIRNYLPRIIDHLGENDMSISYFATQWFITMFSYDLELSHLTKTWNLFFIKGWKVIIRIALSILWHCQDEICSKPADELPTYLKTFVTEKFQNIPEEDLFVAALSFKVSNRLLNYLETLYEHSAPINVILMFGNESKLEWKILPDNCTPQTLSSVQPKDLMEYLNENIDHMKSLNKMKGDAFHQLDNYRNVPFERANTSITLDSISVDHRSPMKVQNPHHQAIKSSDLSFIQTLSSLGRKLKQILTPKSTSQSIFTQQKGLETEIAEFIGVKDPLMGNGTHMTEQSDPRSHNLTRKNCRMLISNNSECAYKKSIVSILKGCNVPLGINLFDPDNFNLQKDRDANPRFGYRTILEASSGNKKLNQTERRKPCLDEPSHLKHKKNSSFNQDSFTQLRDFKSICFTDLANEKSEKDYGSSQSNQFGYTTPSSCQTEPFEYETDKSMESITKKKAAAYQKNFYMAGKYINKGKSLDKVKIISSHQGQSGLTWNDYQKIYATLDHSQRERGAMLSTSKEVKQRPGHLFEYRI